MIYPPGIVVYSGQVGLLSAIYPQCQAPIIRPRRCRRPPVQLDKVGCIADGEPTGARPGRAIVPKSGSKLIVATGKAELNSQHVGRAGHEATEDIMAISAYHRDRVRVEVEAGPITRLSSGSVVGDVDGVVVVYHRL